MSYPIRLSVAASLTLALAGAWAADGGTAADPQAAAPAEQRANPLGVKPMEAGLLSKSRGGTQVLNDMKLKGTVANNQASNLVTGNNVITDGSFAGANGVPMVVQNSGNNVLIQTATIVNVQMK